MSDDGTQHAENSTAESTPARTTASRLPRRSVLTALAAAAGLAGGGPAAAGSHRTAAGPHRTVPVPTVEGPITGGEVTGEPQTASVVDLAEYDYVQEEYFISGEAEATATIGTSTSETAAYTTRVLVFRPRHRRDFNGTVVAEWPNVTNQRDVPVLWANAHEYVLRNGYAFAIISAQEVGVQDSELGWDLVTWDPERYGDLHHPGDTYAHSIFSQAIQALRLPPGQRRQFAADTDPLGGFNVRTVLATGMSQSAYYLRPYINQVHEHHGVIDGFLPVAAGTIGDDGPVRADVAPVLWLNTEDEASSEQRPDAGTFRLWEVAGASHVNYWLRQYAAASDARDFHGHEPDWDPTEAGQYGEQPDAIYGECGYYNYFPVRYAYAAALDHLHAWVTADRTPPTPPRIETVNGEVQTDAFGNARGGLRLPPIDVPVAHYDTTCGRLTGQTFRLDAATLAELYPTHEAYVTQMATATEDAVAAGYLLEPEAADLMARVESAPIGTN